MDRGGGEKKNWRNALQPAPVRRLISQKNTITLCNPAGLVQVSKQPKRPKVLKESAKGAFGGGGGSGRESKKSLSHRANPVSHRGKQPKTGFRTVQKTILGLSAWTPENTFRALPKHFWAFWLFWHLYQAGRVPTWLFWIQLSIAILQSFIAVQNSR